MVKLVQLSIIKKTFFFVLLIYGCWLAEVGTIACFASPKGPADNSNRPEKPPEPLTQLF